MSAIQITDYYLAHCGNGKKTHIAYKVHYYNGPVLQFVPCNAQGKIETISDKLDWTGSRDWTHDITCKNCQAFVRKTVEARTGCL